MEDVKKPIGRPTKYTPEMCDKIIELGKIGASKHEMALELDISIDTFMVWQEENKDFSEAVSRAVNLSQGWWEKSGRVATFGGYDGFNATSFIFNMKNRFKNDWRDKQENELSSPGGGPLVTTVNFVNAKHND